MLFHAIVQEIKERPVTNLTAAAGFLLAIYAFGKLVDSQVDTDKNWQDYLDSKKRS